ncbi:cation:dicarboxylase symporter family transporter [Salmonella enterica]|nr:cation:dicarboxylase symporter family transporter [Salmonella enterica]ELF1619428.1 cation:dicarboxylase symporter family transporter [Salmonella enterica]
MKNLKVSLAWQILLAMVLGILLGSYLHYHSDSREWLIANLLSPAGDIFIHLIKMIVVPIVISTLIVGIAGVGDAKQLGRIGAKTILYFELITTVAIILGITLANVFQPGSGIDMSQLATVDISKYQNTTAEVQSHAHGLMGTILSLVPTGYSFNLDGSTLYQSIAAIFIAQLYGIDLSLWQEIVLVLTLMVTSKGIAGVPGVSFVVLLATLGSVGIPLEGLAFIAGVDRILDMARTALNVVGNALAVLVIAKWEHKFDRKKALAYERDVLGKFDKTAQ